MLILGVYFHTPLGHKIDEKFKYSVYIHIHRDDDMATKTISITVEAYERLKSWKEKNESFADVILKIGGRKKLSDFAGMLTEAQADRLENNIHKSRESFQERMNRTRELLK